VTATAEMSADRDRRKMHQSELATRVEDVDE
jgi:hypothetical protein